MKPNIDSSNCILVQDVKVGATQDQITMGSESTQIPTEGNSITNMYVVLSFFRITVQ